MDIDLLLQLFIYDPLFAHHYYAATQVFMASSGASYSPTQPNFFSLLLSSQAKLPPGPATDHRLTASHSQTSALVRSTSRSEASPPIVVGPDGDSLSSWSFSASFSSVAGRRESSVPSGHYLITEGSGTRAYRRNPSHPSLDTEPQLSQLPTTGAVSSDAEQEQQQVWFEYGCV